MPVPFAVGFCTGHNDHRHCPKQLDNPFLKFANYKKCHAYQTHNVWVGSALRRKRNNNIEPGTLLVYYLTLNFVQHIVLGPDSESAYANVWSGNNLIQIPLFVRRTLTRPINVRPRTAWSRQVKNFSI